MENIENIKDPQGPDYPALAAEKIAAELKSFTGGSKEKAISKFAAETLTHFCEESPQFAQVVYKTRRTLSDCCAEVMKGTGNYVSDIDVYRGIVRSYFTAEIDMNAGRILQLYGFGDCSAPREVRTFTEGFARAVLRWQDQEQERRAS